MVAATLALWVALAATADERPTTIALPELRTFNMDPKLESFFVEHLALQLKLQGLQVVTRRELETLLGIERQKQLLGCSDKESGGCMAELADALGADGAVLGDMARIGNTFQVNLKIVAGRDGRTLAAFSEAANSQDAMLEVLTRAARELAEPTFRNLGRAPPANVSVVAGPPNLRRVAWAPLAIGVLFAGAGAVGLGLAANTAGDLRAGKPVTDTDGRAAVARGQLQETLGTIGLGVGAAALALGAVFLFFGPRAPVSVAPSASASGGSLVISGSLP